MRLLIYGAGVIGSLYAAVFSGAGYDTTVFARGKRLEVFEEHGLRYEKKGRIYKANINVIKKLGNNDRYDFIFLTVKENQVYPALEELSFNISPNIVTMVNTLEPYENWERACGKGRVIPAFPGAGGGYEEGVLKAEFLPWIIQPTTFAEINGCWSERLERLAGIFQKSGVPYQVARDMHRWQVCHLALVVPIADAYYKAKDPEAVWLEKDVVAGAAREIQDNFKTLCHAGIGLSPWKLNLFRLLPVGILKRIFTVIFRSRFGNLFMYRHAMKAPDEMKRLHGQLYRYLETLAPDSHRPDSG